MEYIINPSIIYWINACSVLHTVLTILAVLAGIVAIVSFLTFLYIFGDYADEEDEIILVKKIMKISIPIFIGLLITLIFIPNKETLIEIQIAKLLTKENVELTVDGLKSVVDYVIEAIKTIK